MIEEPRCADEQDARRRCHLKPVRAFFAGRPAMDVTTAALERYQRERLNERKAPATVNREARRGCPQEGASTTSGARQSGR